jgi:hypothetical protein
MNNFSECEQYHNKSYSDYNNNNVKITQSKYIDNYHPKCVTNKKKCKNIDNLEKVVEYDPGKVIKYNPNNDLEYNSNNDLEYNLNNDLEYNLNNDLEYNLNNDLEYNLNVKKTEINKSIVQPINCTWNVFCCNGSRVKINL